MYLIRLNHSSLALPVTMTGGVAVGFGRAMMVPAAGPGDTVEQVIDLEFAGTQAQIESAMRDLGDAVRLAAEYAAKPAGELVYLECQITSTDLVWRSPVYSGYLEYFKGGADTRVSGNQGGRLHLVRANWWEQVDEVTLKNAQLITNHRDSGHSNMQYIAYDGAERDLPARARIVTTLTTATSAPASLFIGLRNGSPGALDLFFEGQDGAARAGVAAASTPDAGSSDGSYYSMSWNGAAETALWQVDIGQTQMNLARGQPLRVVMRLGDSNPVTASELLWLRWSVVYVDGGGVERTLYESAGSYMPNLQELILGPILYLPPWSVTATAPGLRVVLKATAAGSGAHSLKLDWVDFCPLDGWRYYVPALKSYGISVNDWGQNGVAGPENGIMTHAIEGPGFTLTPGLAKQFVFYFMVNEAAEVSASANLAGTVSIYYRPRKRAL